MTEEHHRLPRKRDIEAAVAAYNSTAPVRRGLPPEAVRLLTVLFPRGGVCQRTVASLAAEGFDKITARRLLRGLIAAGFLSKEHPGRGQGVISTYHLHLPPLVRR
jgi:hypothetical protein